ncbi:MAG TPA: hypothetical protein V6C97_16210 [Oculatellaceae cyanobacterium]
MCLWLCCDLSLGGGDDDDDGRSVTNPYAALNLIPFDAIKATIEVNSDWRRATGRWRVVVVCGWWWWCVCVCV